MRKSTLPYDHAFIISLLNGDQARSNKLLEKVDCDSVLRAVKNHKIDSAIGKQCQLLNDGELRNQLSEVYQTNKIYQLRLTSELCQIQELLAGIDFLPLKGPVLSQFLHNDPTERTSWDLDILIDLKDLDQCTNILQERGYDLLTLFKTEKQKEAIIKHYHHLEFYNTKTGILIELHWSLTGIRGLEIGQKELMPFTSDISVGNNQFRLLNIEHQFEYLSIHGTFHLFNRLQWLSDLKTFVESLTEEQLKAIISHSKKNESYFFILVAFSLLNEVFSIPISSSIQNDIDNNKSVQELTRLSLREIYINSSAVKRSRLELLIRNHKTQFYTGKIRGLIKSILGRNVRPKNWQFFAFPDSVFFLNNLLSRFIWIAGKLRGKL